MTVAAFTARGSFRPQQESRARPEKRPATLRTLCHRARLLVPPVGNGTALMAVGYDATRPDAAHAVTLVAWAARASAPQPRAHA